MLSIRPFLCPLSSGAGLLLQGRCRAAGHPGGLAACSGWGGEWRGVGGGCGRSGAAKHRIYEVKSKRAQPPWIRYLEIAVARIGLHMTELLHELTSRKANNALLCRPTRHGKLGGPNTVLAFTNIASISTHIILQSKERVYTDIGHMINLRPTWNGRVRHYYFPALDHGIANWEIWEGHGKYPARHTWDIQQIFTSCLRVLGQN